MTEIIVKSRASIVCIGIAIFFSKKILADIGWFIDDRRSR